MTKKTYLGFFALLMCVMVLMAACGSDDPTPQETETQYLTKEDLKAELEGGGAAYIILDVRKVADYEEQHIVGSYSGDVDPLVSDSDEYTATGNLHAAVTAATGSETGDADSKFVLVCYAGRKYAETATGLLVDMGVAAGNIYTLEGGINEWKEAGDDYSALLQDGAGLTAEPMVAVDMPKSEKLLSADDLEALMAAQEIKIFDLRGAEDFEEGHIPGAMNIANTQFEDPDNEVDGEIATVAQFEALMSSYGVTAEDLIVVYADAERPQMSTRLIWTFEVYEHTNTYVLDGHYQHWVNAGKEIETGPAQEVASAEYTVRGVDNSINVDKDAVINRAANTILLDVRPADEFSGEKVANGNARGGHIPEALNQFYMNAVDDEGFFYDAAYLSALYGQMGITADDEVIVYCQRGHRASHTWFVLQHILGFDNVKVYDGSMMEWSNLEELPIAEGNETAASEADADGDDCEA